MSARVGAQDCHRVVLRYLFELAAGGIRMNALEVNRLVDLLQKEQQGKLEWKYCSSVYSFDDWFHGLQLLKSGFPVFRCGQGSHKCGQQQL